MAANRPEAAGNWFALNDKTVLDMEYLALNNTQGTTEIHANTSGSRFAFMGMSATTNTTGATVSIQDRTSGTVLVGTIPTVVNTHISGFICTGFPYAVSADDTGMQIVVSGAARVDGVLQFLEVPNA